MLNKCYDLFRVSQWGCPQLLVAPRAWCSGPWCPLVCGAGAPTWEVGAGGVQRLQTLQVAVAALAVLLQGALLLVAAPAALALQGLACLGRRHYGIEEGIFRWKNVLNYN